MSKTIQEIVEGWAKNPSASTELNSEEYEIIANNYDDYLINSMGYDLWSTFYDSIENFVSRDMKVLDICCGTGLIGLTLAENGFENIDGVDLSEMMLDVANRKGVYTHLTQHNMNEPLLVSEPYDMVTCFGALTYFETKDVLENIFALVKEGGIIVLSHRDDLYDFQHYGEYLRNHPHVDIVAIDYGLPYLPLDPNYANDIKVNLIVLRKNS